jgi:hypothetical protein
MLGPQDADPMVQKRNIVTESGTPAKADPRQRVRMDCGR